MTDDQLVRFIHPDDKYRVPGGLRMRYAFLTLLLQTCPESDDAVLLLDNELDHSSVYVAEPPAEFRWPGWPRVPEAKRRLGQQVAAVFPECRRAGAFFFKDRAVIGFLRVPLPGRGWE